MARRLKIGIDVDEVLVDFLDAFKIEAERILQRPMVGEPIDWPMSNWMTPEEKEKVWNEILNSADWFYLRTASLPTVVENISWITSQHECYFITARVQTVGMPVQIQTQLYLSDIGVEFPTVLVAHDKGPLIKSLSLDIFVDDKGTNLAWAQRYSPSTKLYMMETAQNRSEQTPPNWTRVSTFREFCDKVKDISERKASAN